MRIALLHPQCRTQGGAIKMALLTAQSLQKQGHEVTLYTFDHSAECFPELQKNIIIVHFGMTNEQGIMNNEGNDSDNHQNEIPTYSDNKDTSGGDSLDSTSRSQALLAGMTVNDTVDTTPPFSRQKFSPFQKISRIIKLAWHVRHVDIIIANNPPMQIVAALAKFFRATPGLRRQNPGVKLVTIWWHHHIPWYYTPKNEEIHGMKNEEGRMKNEGIATNSPLEGGGGTTGMNMGVSITDGGTPPTPSGGGGVGAVSGHQHNKKHFFKSWLERHLILPYIDHLVATSEYVAKCLRNYCGREATVIHPVIMNNEQGIMNNAGTVTNSPLEGGQELEASPQSQSPFTRGKSEAKGVLYQGRAKRRGFCIGEERSEGGLEPGEAKGSYGFTYPINTSLKDFSHEMSRQMTRAEQRLWFEVLKSKRTGQKWVRQKIIGSYIVDFYCHEKRLVVEVDGGIHTERTEYDAARTRYLEEYGVQVIRFTNELVMNQIETVEEILMQTLQKNPPLTQNPLDLLDSTPIAKPSVLRQAQDTSLKRETGSVFSCPPNPLDLLNVSTPLEGGLATPERPITLFTHGRLEPGKGLETLVKIWKGLQNPWSTTIPLKGELENLEPVPVPLHKGEERSEGGFVIDSDINFQQNGIRLLIAGEGSLKNWLTEQGATVVPYYEGLLNDIQTSLLNPPSFDKLRTPPLKGRLASIPSPCPPSKGEERSEGGFDTLAIYLSTIDAFGMASLEAQIAGLSTIILDRGGAGETVLLDSFGAPVGQLVGTEEEIPQAITYFIQHKSLQKTMSNVNFCHQRDYFSSTRLDADIRSLIGFVG